MSPTTSRASARRPPSEAINQAKVDVAEQEKMGAIGQAEANREQDNSVAENAAESGKGQKTGRGRPAYLRAATGSRSQRSARPRPTANKEISVAENAPRPKRARRRPKPTSVFSSRSRKPRPSTAKIPPRPTSPTTRPNWPLSRPTRSNGRSRQARGRSRDSESPVPGRTGTAERRGSRPSRRSRNGKIEIAAEAEAEKTRREARGEADAILMKYEAEARRSRQVLESKAAGTPRWSRAAAATPSRGHAADDRKNRGDRRQAGRGDQEPQDRQDHRLGFGGGGNGRGRPTANFVSSLIKSVPPLQELRDGGHGTARYLGRMTKEADQALSRETSPRSAPGS